MDVIYQLSLYQSECKFYLDLNLSIFLNFKLLCVNDILHIMIYDTY